MARLFLLWVFCCASCWAALPVAVEQRLARAGIPNDAVALVVQAVDAERPRWSHRAEAAMNPASLMKLLTTFAALERLGPQHAFCTEALASAPLRAGVLAGDLYLRGGGDPKFTFERLWLLLRELRARGIEEIQGDLVLDGHVFSPPVHDPAAFDGKPQRPYNVGPDGLLFNFATLHLTLLPENGGVRVLAEPWPADWRLDNRLRARGGLCPEDWRERLTAEILDGTLRLSGDYPTACGEKRWHLAGIGNDTLLFGAFRRYWQELGGRFSGSVKRGRTPAEARLLAVSDSPPLAELIRDINKFSNNVMAEQLLLALGRREEAADRESGLAVLSAWLAERELSFPELVLENGSGLSRKNRIAAASLARLLQAAWKSPWMPEFVASLPIVGIDGTTRRRFNGHPATGFAHLKTGSLEGVRGIAGYLQDRQGRRWIVVFLVEHARAALAQEAIDRLIEGLWQGGF